MTERLSWEEIEALKREILSSLHCAVPGTVESFDPAAGTAVIRPANSRLPLLRDVPVYLPEERTITSGEFCLVLFADFDVDQFLSTGESGVPTSGRSHSLCDAFAFVGFKAGGSNENASD